MTISAPQETADAPRYPRLLAPVLLIGAAVAVYADSFSGVFLFDDYGRIVENENLRRLWPPGPWLGARRPLVELTLALNYIAGGLHPWGYHLVNLLIHTAAGLTLFGIIRRTALLAGGRLRESSATWLACAASMVWLVHPLNTQSVTYVIQRGESLMGLLYMLCMYTLLRGVQSSKPWRWFALTIAACALGMSAKAVMVTAPVVLLCFDRMFLASSWRELVRRRAGLYVCLMLTWSVLAMCGVAQAVLQTGAKAGANVGFAYHGISPLDYAMTQPGVILHYLCLSMWPDVLCLDYQWPVAKSVGAVLGPALIVVGMLIATVGGVIYRHWLGFAGVWFFLILAPTSSIVPIKDVIFEHRMYLPLAAVATIVVFAGYAVVSRIVSWFSLGHGPRAALAAGFVLAAVVPLGWRTVVRNRDYHSSLAMWQSVVDARPGSDRAHFGLGVALYREGHLDDAESSLNRAIELTPRYADAHFNLGVIHTAQGDLEAALASYRRAIELAPTRDRYAKALVDLLLYMRRTTEARAVLRQTIVNVPGADWARQKLAELDARRGI